MKMKLMNHNQGSALILVLMITLVLSAFGLVAMRDIATGVHQSASFRVRAQASTLSDSAAAAFAMRAGNKPDAYIHAINASAMKSNGAGAVVFGGSNPAPYYKNTIPSPQQFRKDLASHGGFVVFNDKDLSGFVPNSFDPVPSGSQENETGLFRGPGSESSFEVKNASEFRVILRDIKEGIPAPGFSQKYCFKKATAGARSQVGTLPGTITEPARVGVGIHANEILIGPIECGYN